MTNSLKDQSSNKCCLSIAVSSLILWCLCVTVMVVMLIDKGFDLIILNQPYLFLSLLAVSIFLLATGINHLISYYQIKHLSSRD